MGGRGVKAGMKVHIARMKKGSVYGGKGVD